MALKVKVYVPAKIACCKLSAACLAAAASGADAEAAATLRDGFLLALSLTRQVMLLSVEARDLFDSMKGGEVVVGMLRDHEGDVELQVQSHGRDGGCAEGP